MLDECARLLEVEQYEPYILHLVRLPKGQWDPVSSTLPLLNLDLAGISRSTFAAWLESPREGENYVFIVFYDDDTGEVLTAEYNRARLLRSRGAE